MKGRSTLFCSFVIVWLLVSDIEDEDDWEKFLKDSSCFIHGAVAGCCGLGVRGCINVDGGCTAGAGGCATGAGGCTTGAGGCTTGAGGCTVVFATRSTDSLFFSYL
jgi:hypothetical protein